MAKVLIVEDEKSIAKVLSLKLNKEGIEADIAYNGQEALAKLSEGGYQCVLLDLMMPVVDGFGVLQELKTRGDKTPVLITSNLGQDEDIEKAKALGAKDYFVKADVSLTDIVAKIKNIL